MGATRRRLSACIGGFKSAVMVPESQRDQEPGIKTFPFMALFSCLSRRFSLMLFFGAFTSFFGDLSPIAEILLPDGWQCSHGFRVFGTLPKSADAGVHLAPLPKKPPKAGFTKPDAPMASGVQDVFRPGGIVLFSIPLRIRQDTTTFFYSTY